MAGSENDTNQEGPKTSSTHGLVLDSRYDQAQKLSPLTLRARFAKSVFAAPNEGYPTHWIDMPKKSL
jgi:hypothetical protein